MMPVMDGWEVLGRLSELQARKRLRVIVMTAKGGDRDIAKGLELGASEYVIKPFEIDELIALIAEVLVRSPEEAERRRSELLAKFVS
jgi:DNA-binding response OmpR family regulator